MLMRVVISKSKASLPEIVEAMQNINPGKSFARENIYRHLEILVSAGLIGKQYDQNLKKIYYLPKIRSIKMEFTQKGIEVIIKPMRGD